VYTGTTFPAHGTSSLDFTVTFADGRYVTGSAAEHFSFTAAGRVTVFYGCDQRVTHKLLN
jgi:hypothetical protein